MKAENGTCPRESFQHLRDSPEDTIKVEEDMRVKK